ncbi:MAG: sulfotransferase family protein [Pseudomonadaceae bacterium]|nr:sulfotransferase family protein [Pseudomonadaceae bacterium]
MISHDEKYVFVHIPKTAGTSIEKLLGHFEELERGMQDHRTVREMLSVTPGELVTVARREGPVQAARELRGVLRYPERMSQKAFASYFSFAIVRNPFARVVSWYKNIMRDEIHQKNRNVPADISFSDFLEQHSWHTELRPQMAWIKDRNGRVCVDYVGRFEALGEAMRIIADKLGKTEADLPHLLDGGSDSHTSFYDNASRKLVAQRYAEEIELFGYDFDTGDAGGAV